MSHCTGSLGKCLLAGDFSSHPARLPVAADSEVALAEAALSALLAAPRLCCGAVILVTAMELHGEGSSRFPYIASVMRQLQGGLWYVLSFILPGGSRASWPPACCYHRASLVWCGSCAPGGKGPEAKGQSVRPQGNLSVPPIREERWSVMPPHCTPVPRAQGSGAGCTCIGAPGGNGLA